MKIRFDSDGNLIDEEGFSITPVSGLEASASGVEFMGERSSRPVATLDTERVLEDLLGARSGDRAEDAIFIQEAHGARALAASTQLPIEGSDDPAWARMGITFGEKTDDLFREASLPAGWKKDSAGSDPRGMGLYDAQNRKRGTIFYKAAFYDRKANMYPDRRFRVMDEYDEVTHKRCLPGKIAPVVVDTISGKPEVVFRSTPVDDPTEDEHGEYKKPKPEDHRKTWDLRERLQEEQRMVCCAWLDKHYPGNDDPAAWWNRVVDLRGKSGNLLATPAKTDERYTLRGAFFEEPMTLAPGDGIVYDEEPGRSVYLHVMKWTDVKGDRPGSFAADVIAFVPSERKSR